MPASSASPSTTAKTVFRIWIGGEEGLRMMIALPSPAPPTVSSAEAVVRVNSSMFCLVPGPAERLAVVAPRLARGTACTTARGAADQAEVPRVRPLVAVDRRHDGHAQLGRSQVDHLEAFCRVRGRVALVDRGARRFEDEIDVVSLEYGLRPLDRRRDTALARP